MSVRTVTPAGGAPYLAFAYGDGTEHLQSGQIIDVEPGSALEAAIGTGNLTDLTGQALSDAANGAAGAVSN
jgi:hypothetical protein